jgi:polysaccharide export outer membrane protein
MIADRLRKFVREPHVSVGIAEYHSAPVSVLGQVNTPGVYQLAGPKRLMELISMAGGLRPDAGAMIEIRRETAVGELDILGATLDDTKRFRTAKVNVYDLTSGKSPALNIQMMANDIVSVPKADLIYVIGEVKKSGGFTLRANEKMSVLEALALAEGMERTAPPIKAKIQRAASETGERTEIPVNLSRILANRGEDIRLRSEDILVIRNNSARSVALRATEIAVQLGTGMVIFRR